MIKLFHTASVSFALRRTELANMCNNSSTLLPLRFGNFAVESGSYALLELNERACKRGVCLTLEEETPVVPPSRLSRLPVMRLFNCLI